ncbi:hypothetical protein ACTWQB_11895 [Piscibacillus sp. B03]|uniref:hypothetical protein n=1 Tax=Piscibacillus sp. B03 TaxID=3457430 RepID=UPI003FCE4657
MVKTLWVLIIFSLIFLMACNSEGEGEQQENSVIADEKVLPADFEQIAFVRDTSQMHRYYVQKASSQDELEMAWEFYRFEGQMPEVNFNQQQVVFVGFQESGSCPYEVTKIDLESDNSIVNLKLTQSQENCTADATPRTLAFEFNHEALESINEIVITQGKVETTVPIESTK